jgi:hypothetical protein
MRMPLDIKQIEQLMILMKTHRIDSVQIDNVVLTKSKHDQETKTLTSKEILDQHAAKPNEAEYSAFEAEHAAWRQGGSVPSKR